jgi:hypothetical protein
MVDGVRMTVHVKAVYNPAVKATSTTSRRSLESVVRGAERYWTQRHPVFSEFFKRLSDPSSSWRLWPELSQVTNTGTVGTFYLSIPIAYLLKRKIDP